MQVNCISCGHRFDLGKNYDDYEGFVKCATCGGLLDIKTEEGDVKRVRPGMMSTNDSFPTQQLSPPTAPAAATADAQALEDMRRTIAELQAALNSASAVPSATPKRYEQTTTSETNQ